MGKMRRSKISLESLPISLRHVRYVRQITRHYESLSVHNIVHIGSRPEADGPLVLNL